MSFTKTLLTTAALLVAALSIGVVSGCRTFANAHGRQNLPAVIRIVSEPAGADLRLTRYNLILTTPADIERDIDPSDRLVITKEGYWTFRGTLEDIPQIALDTYLVKLRKVGE